MRFCVGPRTNRRGQSQRVRACPLAHAATVARFVTQRMLNPLACRTRHFRGSTVQGERLGARLASRLATASGEPVEECRALRTPGQPVWAQRQSPSRAAAASHSRDHPELPARAGDGRSTHLAWERRAFGKRSRATQYLPRKARVAEGSTSNQLGMFVLRTPRAHPSVRHRFAPSHNR